MCHQRSTKLVTMRSRPRWPDSHHQLSHEPGTLQVCPNAQTRIRVCGTVRRRMIAQHMGVTMDTTTLLIIVLVVLALGGGGLFYRRRV